MSIDSFLPMISFKPFNRNIKKVGIRYTASHQENSDVLILYASNIYGIAVDFIEIA